MPALAAVDVEELCQLTDWLQAPGDGILRFRPRLRSTRIDRVLRPGFQPKPLDRREAGELDGVQVHADFLLAFAAYRDDEVMVEVEADERQQARGIEAFASWRWTAAAWPWPTRLDHPQAQRTLAVQDLAGAAGLPEARAGPNCRTSAT